MKYLTLTKEIWIFVKPVSVLSGICWCGCHYIIQYSIHDNFIYFMPRCYENVFIEYSFLHFLKSFPHSVLVNINNSETNLFDPSVEP